MTAGRRVEYTQNMKVTLMDRKRRAHTLLRPPDGGTTKEKAHESVFHGKKVCAMDRQRPAGAAAAIGCAWGRACLCHPQWAWTRRGSRRVYELSSASHDGRQWERGPCLYLVSSPTLPAWRTLPDERCVNFGDKMRFERLKSALQVGHHPG